MKSWNVNEICTSVLRSDVSSTWWAPTVLLCSVCKATTNELLHQENGNSPRKGKKTNYWYLERLLSRDWTRSEWTRSLVMVDLQRPDCRPDWRSDQLVAPQRLVSWKTFPENARSNPSEQDEYWPVVFVVSIDQVRNTKISGTEYLFSKNDECSKNDKWNFNERFLSEFTRYNQSQT